MSQAMKRTVLFICGSINQTTQMHAVARHLPEFAHAFTPYYGDGLAEVLRRARLAERTVMGSALIRRCREYLEANGLPIDYRGTMHRYDLVVTCSDLLVPANVRGSKMVLVQEGMTDPENLMYHLVKRFGLPRYLASTSTTGLSHAYDYFCVASEGYRDHFIRKGVEPGAVRVTGIPNFDNCVSYCDNDFPFTGFVLAATSDARETLKYENRRKFIRECLEIADGRPLIFKLHPNENAARATREINRWAPDAMVFAAGDVHAMIANCDVLITKFSSVVYVGMALGKEVRSAFDMHELRRMTPLQNGGRSAAAIAEVCRRLVHDLPVPDSYDELHALAAGHTNAATTAPRPDVDRSPITEMVGCAR